jgi:hypothetical protein
MDLEKIRKMNDEELESFLRALSNKKNACIKCGKTNPNYTMNIQNKNKIQQKKLCSLCNDCYGDLLDYLGVCDILWD